MCTLAGVDCGVDSSLEPLTENMTVAVVVRCPSLTASQLQTCSASCAGGPRVTCSDAGKTYVGECLKVCVMEHGATVFLGGCSCL